MNNSFISTRVKSKDLMHSVGVNLDGKLTPLRATMVKTTTVTSLVGIDITGIEAALIILGQRWTP